MSDKTDFFRNVLRKIKLKRIRNEIKTIISRESIENLKTQKGDTQNSERLSINLIRTALDNLNYSYEEASSQQSKDFRNICLIGLNIEVKKTDSFTVYFNDTFPNSDIYYIIFFTGKKYKTKEDIPPKIIFCNGYDISKHDIYYLIDFKKELEQKKDMWCRKTKNDKACKLKYMSVYLRPTYKTTIHHLMENKNYCLTVE